MAGPQVEHIVKSYDQELSRLRGLITQMGGLVESQAANATRAVIEHDVQAATFAVQDDPQVDALERSQYVIMRRPAPPLRPAFAYKVPGHD